MHNILTPLYGLGLALHHKDKEGAWQLGKTIILQTVLTQAMKYGLNKTTVQGTRLGERLSGGNRNFPSGHTAETFAAAWFVKERYGWLPSLPALALASFTGFSRVDTDHHTMSAVGFSALTGILSAEIITRVFPGNKNHKLNLNSTGKDLALNYSLTF